MAHDHRSDPAMDKALRRSLSGTVSATAEGKNCPDPSILAAYFDRKLSFKEAEHWEAHFSVCARCQDQLAVLARTEPAMSAAQLQAKASGWQHAWRLRWLAPLATAAAAVMLWVAIRPAPPTIPAPEVTVASRQEATVPEPPAAKEAERDSVAAKPPAVAGDKIVATEKTAVVGRKAEATIPSVPSPRATTLASNVAQAPGVGQESQAALRRDQASVDVSQSKPQAVIMAEAVRDEAKAKPLESVPKKSREEVPATLAAEGARSRAAAQAPEDQRALAVGVLKEASPGQAGLMAFREPQIVVASPEGNVRWRFGVRGLIEKSTDAGKTWNRQASPVTVDFVAGSAPSENVCWAIGMSGIVLRTTNGERWEKVAELILGSAKVASLTARDASNATVTTTDGQAFVTSDGGQSWRTN